MKFNETWNEEYKKLPPDLQRHCLLYKKWKKLSKTELERKHVQTLEQECIKASMVLQNMLHKIYKDNCGLCFIQKHVPVSEHDLLTYAKLNKTTLYKICKRLDKRQQSKKFMIWFEQHYKMYSFNYGSVLTFLMMEDGKDCDYTCPICLEDIQSTSPFIILRCGHIMCWHCFSDFYDIHGKKGLISSIVSNVDAKKKRSCPTCRCPRPGEGIGRLNIWPQRASSLLKTINH